MFISDEVVPVLRVLVLNTGSGAKIPVGVGGVTPLNR